MSSTSTLPLDFSGGTRRGGGPPTRGFARERALRGLGGVHLLPRPSSLPVLGIAAPWPLDGRADQCDKNLEAGSPTRTQGQEAKAGSPAAGGPDHPNTPEVSRAGNTSTPLSAHRGGKCRAQFGRLYESPGGMDDRPECVVRKRSESTIRQAAVCRLVAKHIS